MAAIEIVSASAGSGKTTRLSTLLEERVVGGQVRPEAVLATTFTNKAAAELQERVRSRLLRAGRPEDAHRLAAARIGTVNSVCGRLLSDFAFELGLRPELDVLAPELAEAALLRAISDVITREEEDRFAELAERMVELDPHVPQPGLHWRKAVRLVIDLARSNGISAPELEGSAARSIAQIEPLLGESGDARTIDEGLLRALEGFVSSVDRTIDKTKDTTESLEAAAAAIGRLKQGRAIPWKDWAKFCNLKTGARSRELGVPVREAAAAHDRHPLLRADLVSAIRGVFSLAARALASYEAQKRAWGTIDFVDQEVLALQLLRRPELAERLRGEIDLVLVDEFQDTSPLQLAIFLELSRVAKQSIWVGDQKQSIYGFRGTDPALMDAAIGTILAGAEPETLGRSYRSRPALVRLTSELFVPPFGIHGLPASRVRLEPGRPVEPEGLGPIVERWVLARQGNEKEPQLASIAAGVKGLLCDPSARVRDRDGNDARRVRPGDIAVLCLRNETCTALAAQLAALGIRAVLPRSGLLATPEGRVALAALRLWVDPSDSLAMAQLAQAAEFAGREDEWLAAVLRQPRAAAFERLPIVAAIREAREGLPLAGAVAALDAAMEAAGLRELCLRWGESEARLANLEALRVHAVLFEGSCADQGIGCTPAGLVAGLEALAKEGLDEQAVSASEDAVVLSTWHAAKGLEWPVTVLYELEGMKPASALGVQVVSEAPFRLDDPLADRWIRYWPHPFHQSQSNTPFHARLGGHPATVEALERDGRQRLRLLYVGWTRARDRLVFAAKEGKLLDGMLSLLADEKGPLLSELQATDTAVTWGGVEIPIAVRNLAPLPAEAQRPEPGSGWMPRGRREHPAAWLAPSSLEGSARCGAPVTIGTRAPLSGKPDMNALGEAIHGFLGADLPTLARGDRMALAEGLLRRWGVPDALRPESVLAIGDALRSWVGGQWPGAQWHREAPVLHRIPGGSVVRGSIDLLLETDDGLVIVDHKSFPGDVASALERAVSHAGQLHAYADAARAATGKPVIGTFIHLAVSGLVVPVELD